VGPDSLAPVRGPISRENSRTLEAFPFLIVSFINLFVGTTERTTRVFRLKSFLTTLSTSMFDKVHCAGGMSVTSWVI
jgi:hypothetical protein